MAKTIDDISRSLKLRAESKGNALTFRIGVKKYTLPFEVRALNSTEFVFIHLPPSAGIFKIANGELTAVASVDEAQAAVSSFRKARKPSKRTRKVEVAMPTELEEALRKLPAGYKLAYDAAGQVKMVKTRKRKK